MKVSAIIAAAGSSSRFKNGQKLLFDLNGCTVIEKTLSAFQKHPMIDEIVICTSENLIDEIRLLSEKFSKVSKIILGGATRQDSVLNGLKSVSNPDFVAIHDGARPLISQETITSTINKAIECGHATCAVQVKDTIKKVIEDKIVETPIREQLWQVQTPQVFCYKEILDAHVKWEGHGFTDDTLLIEKTGKSVYIVKGCYENLKITTPEDIDLARALAKK
jgi:2-C-methyl-D-erythritol 4-phosphate cytidylyltransferase